MSEPGPAVQGVVFAHGAVAAALVDAVSQITGVRDALVPLSNEQVAPTVLAERLREAAGAGPTLIFTDLRSSSCSVVARRAVEPDTRWAVVCGANLPMLLDFVFNRTLPLDVLVARLVDRGREGVLAVLQPSPDVDRADPG